MPIRDNITAQTKILCVIGYPIEHSMSPIMHNAALQDLELDYVYLAFDVPPNRLKEAVKGLKVLNVKGISVTIPLKEKIIKFLDEVESTAQKIGAINTIKYENGVMIGKNTDAEGGRKAILDAGCEIKDKNILILGAGGVAKAICYVLAKDANKIVISNRTENRAKQLAKELRNKININIEGTNNSKTILRREIKTTDILINATSVGMYPFIDKSPIDKEILHNQLFVFDLIYNPLETQLIKDANAIGCRTLGGLDMLVNQGVIAFEWWTNEKPNKDLMKNKILEFLEKK
ncbi:MAG: shikimate dehydrogenase [Candidatus Hodarchaeota archaeon]